MFSLTSTFSEATLWDDLVFNLKPLDATKTPSTPSKNRDIQMRFGLSVTCKHSSIFLKPAAKAEILQKLNCLLTCNKPGGDEELADGLGKRAGSHSKPTQDSAQHDRRSATKSLHQHATKGTCGSNFNALSLMRAGAEKTHTVKARSSS